MTFCVDTTLVFDRGSGTVNIYLHIKYKVPGSSNLVTVGPDTHAWTETDKQLIILVGLVVSIHFSGCIYIQRKRTQN